MAKKVMDKLNYLYEYKLKIIDTLLKKGITLPKTATWRQIRTCILWYYLNGCYTGSIMYAYGVPYDGLSISEREVLDRYRERLEQEKTEDAGIDVE
jgi:hypothetical protein|nr:MAG TPA: hypothetical protein [Caudoviricetes sp.]